jgi:hypothetical protein
MGTLKSIKGKVPHPDGDIIVDLQKTDTGITGKVILPEGLPGRFVWNKNQIQLNSGENKISMH